MVVADGRAPAFQAVVNHLELGGRAFSLSKRDFTAGDWS